MDVTLYSVITMTVCHIPNGLRRNYRIISLDTAVRELFQIMFADLEESVNNRTKLKSLPTADTRKNRKLRNFSDNQIKFIQGD